MARKILLVVIEGFGMRRDVDGNAVALAHKPHFDRLWTTCSRATLSASGSDVGLPAGLKGCAESGYLTLGTGRAVPSESVRLDELIAEREFFKNRDLIRALDRVKKTSARLHLLGLVSDGNVHSRDSHWLALLEAAKQRGVANNQVLVHAFLDGRDTGTKTGLTQTARLMAEMVALGLGRIASVVGRSYAMDRDARWPRTEQACRLLAENKGLLAASPIDAVRQAYARGEADETLSPTVVLGANGLPSMPLADGDTVINFNLGYGRNRQLYEALTADSFPHFKRYPSAVHWHWLSAMTREHVLFPPRPVHCALTSILLPTKQLGVICPESKLELLSWPFTGYNGLTGDVPLLLTATHRPQEIVDALETRAAPADLIVCALTAVEEAGHRSLAEAVRALEAVDVALGRARAWAEQSGYDVVVTSTHGNAEQMTNPDTGGPYPSHTTHPVPFILAGRDQKRIALRDDGTLADVAPTLLALLEVPVPDEMDGVDLRVHAARSKRRLHPKHPHVHPEALAAIEAGLREEIDSARFYLLAAATARDRESRELCLRLAHDEEIHLARLRERYETLTGAALDLPPSPAVAQEVPSIFDLTVVEILDSAIASEAETYRMFMSLSKKAGDAQAAEILRALGEEEREHVEQLSRAKAEAEARGKHYRVPERIH